MSESLNRRTVAALLTGRATEQGLEAASRRSDFIPFLEAHAVGPLVYHGLRTGNLQHTIPPAQLTQLKRAYSAQLMIEDLRLLELKRISTAFDQKPLPALLVKGTALAYTLYELPHLRVRGDTDLFIPEPTKTELVSCLERLGYARILRIPGEATMYQLEFRREAAPGFPTSLDVHWRLSNLEIFSRIFDFNELWQTSIPIPALGFRGPCPVDSLLLACVHRVAHHNRSRTMIWLFDIHLLAQRLSGAERSRLVERAAHLKILEVCRDGLEETIQDFMTPQIEALLELLPRARGGSEPTGDLLRKHSSLHLLWSDFKTLQGRARWRWLKDQLFPPLDYMRSRYRTRSRFRLAYLYVWRALHGVWKRSKPWN